MTFNCHIYTHTVNANICRHDQHTDMITQSRCATIFDSSRLLHLPVRRKVTCQRLSKIPLTLLASCCMQTTMEEKTRKKKKAPATFFSPSDTITHNYTVSSTAGRRVRQKTVHTVERPTPEPSDYDSGSPYSSDSDHAPVNPTSDAQLTGFKVVARAKRYTNSVSDNRRNFFMPLNQP